MPSQDKVPPPSAMPLSLGLYQMATGHYYSLALGVVAKMKIADLLKDGPRHYDDLARAAGAHGPSLNRVLRLLASAGVFEEQEGGKFVLTGLGQYLRSDVPGSMRASVLLFSGTHQAWQELEYCVQTGEPWFHRTDPTADGFALMAQNPEQLKIFDQAMATFAPMTSAAVAASYDFSTFGTVVDVGGGNGALLIGILKANPDLRGIVFDQPHAAEKAAGNIAAAGLESRCQAVGGDFFKSVPPNCDAYLLKHVIHDWNDDRALAILKNCHRVMGPDSKLLIIEGVYPPRIDQSDSSQGAARNDVNMLVCTGGRQRSEAEFRSLYDTAGFRLTRIVPTPARVCVIEGARA